MDSQLIRPPKVPEAGNSSHKIFSAGVISRRSSLVQSAGAIIDLMDANFDIKLYRERWKAVEEIERQELRAMSIEKHWKQINNLIRFAIENGLTRGKDDSEMEVFRRWAKLRGFA